MEKRGLSFRQTCSIDRQGEGKAFESAVQQQQKTFPLDRVVKNGCRGRGGIWHVTWRKGGAYIPTLARHVPLLLAAAGCGHIAEKTQTDGGKQVELRGDADRQIQRASVRKTGRQRDRMKSKSGSERILRSMEAYHEQGQKDTAWQNRK